MGWTLISHGTVQIIIKSKVHHMPYKCKVCGDKLKLFMEIDTYACMTCDEWTEKRCSDKTCGYCNLRTNKPSEFNNK